MNGWTAASSKQRAALVPVGDGLLDPLGFLFACQLAHQLQRKRDRTAQPVAGGDVAVHHDLLVQYGSTGQLVLEGGVGGGLLAL